MSKVLVNKYSEVVEYIGTQANAVSNGIDVGEFIFGQASLVNIVDIEVPDGVIAQKYCYNAAKGFYLNPNYVAPISGDAVISLQEQTAQILLALVQGGLM